MVEERIEHPSPRDRNSACAPQDQQAIWPCVRLLDIPCAQCPHHDVQADRRTRSDICARGDTGVKIVGIATAKPRALLRARLLQEGTSLSTHVFSLLPSSLLSIMLHMAYSLPFVLKNEPVSTRKWTHSKPLESRQHALVAREVNSEYDLIHSRYMVYVRDAIVQFRRPPYLRRKGKKQGCTVGSLKV